MSVENLVSQMKLKKMTLDDLPNPKLKEYNHFEDKENLNNISSFNTAIQQDVQTKVHQEVKEYETEKLSLGEFIQKFDNSDKKNKGIEKIIRSKKMTIYLTENLYDSFNKIYAKRILEGRSTDKSGLIEEAIELLFFKEMKE